MSVRWACCYADNIPHNAVVGGNAKGEDLYVGRAWHNGGLLPGKVVRSLQCCYVPCNNSEHKYQHYEILVNDGAELKWIPSCDGHVPDEAIPGGKSAAGETLYIGRTRHEGTVTCGKVHPSQGLLYIPYYHREHRYNGYEVLVNAGAR
ncbi:natterin-4-like [Amblyomma americanum]